MSYSAAGTKRYTCGFCDRAAGDGTVGRLIAGPGSIAICDSCVLDGLSLVVASTPTPSGTSPARCRFCAMTTGTGVLIDRPASGVTICAQCLALCLEILQDEMDKGEWQMDRPMPVVPVWVAAGRRETPLAPPSVIVIDAFDPTQSAASETEQSAEDNTPELVTSIDEAVTALERAILRHALHEALSADLAAQLAARLAEVQQQLLSLTGTDSPPSRHDLQPITAAA